MKNINFNELEILSPAGNPECFYANINNVDLNSNDFIYEYSKFLLLKQFDNLETKN